MCIDNLKPTNKSVNNTTKQKEQEKNVSSKKVIPCIQLNKNIFK